MTRQFADGVALEMRLPDLHLQFLHNGKAVPHVFDPQERSPAEAEAWILVELLHRGIDREKFSKKLPYTIPGLLTGDAEDYAPQDCRKGLIQLTDWFGKAAAVLEAAARARSLDKAEVICLPQTLDLVLAPLSGASSIPLGFSPGDTENPEPYFYTGGAANPASAKAAPRHREWQQTTRARRCCPRGSDALENGRGLIGDNPESPLGVFEPLAPAGRRVGGDLMIALQAPANVARFTELLHDRDESIGHRQDDFAFRPE